MRYLMKQHLFSFGDDFTIQDAAGQPAFLVDGKMFSLGNQLSFQDLERRELAAIQQRLLSWGPTYEIYQNQTLVATVKKHLLTLLHCRFSVDVPGPDDLEAEGNLTDHEYVFRRGARVIATVSKHWVALSDTYGIDIVDGEDDVLLLASAVVIDLACHDEQKR
jgi:uncharacterized protein YxjI